MEKKLNLILIIIILFISSINAINLEVSSKPIQNNVIVDLNEPAVFDLRIMNLGETDNFEIYSLVGVDITPESVKINSGEAKTIRIRVMPQDSLKISKFPLNFEYKIKNSKNEIEKYSLSINIIGFEDSFLIEPESINPKSEKITIIIKNNLNFEFKDLNIKTTSAFFEHEQLFSLKPEEKKEIEISLDREKLKVLDAGRYLMNTEISTQGKIAKIESQINFLEQENIETIDNKEGLLIQRREIFKKNIGNVKKGVEVRIEKGFLSYLFTTTSIPPTKNEFKNFKKIYIWERELMPNEKFDVIIKTNWFYPVIIIFLIIFGIILIRKSIYPDLELRKKVSFVKTRGGQFALKVSLIIKAKKFLGRIRITDKLPNLVKLYEKFGAIPPDNIDLKNKRLEWNLESLNKGESRIFSYIIYSKIGVVGRFELPNARAVYEKEGEIKEITSNRSFYINEPKKGQF